MSDQLLKLYRAMKKIFEFPETDWWGGLSNEQQARLNQAIEESYDPNNLIDHEEIAKKHAKWLQK